MTCVKRKCNAYRSDVHVIARLGAPTDVGANDDKETERSYPSTGCTNDALDVPVIRKVLLLLCALFARKIDS